MEPLGAVCFQGGWAFRDDAGRFVGVHGITKKRILTALRNRVCASTARFSLFFMSGSPCQVDAAAPTTMIAYLLLSGVALGALRSVIKHTIHHRVCCLRRGRDHCESIVCFFSRRGSLRGGSPLSFFACGIVFMLSLQYHSSTRFTAVDGVLQGMLHLTPDAATHGLCASEIMLTIFFSRRGGRVLNSTRPTLVCSETFC